MDIVVVIFPCASLTAYGIVSGLKNNKHIHKIIGITSNNKHCDVTDEELFDLVLYNIDRPSGDFVNWNNILQQHNVTHVIPTNDDAVQLFSGIGGSVKYMVPTPKLCDLLHNKKLTYTRWPNISPTLYPNTIVNKWYIKPSVGHSAQGCRPANNDDDLYAISHDPNWVVCEELYGNEYTIECMYNEIIGMRERCLTRNGMSVITKKTKVSDVVTKIFNTIVLTVCRSYNGPWFFQVKGGKLLRSEARRVGKEC